LKQSYRIARDFGPIEKDQILNLMLLKSRCLRQDDALRMAFEIRGAATSFFVSIVGAIDCLMFLLINDEATDCLDERGPIRDLLESIEHDARVNGLSQSSIRAAAEDMAALFRSRTRYVVGSAYLDFVVSTFSAFEMFMAKVYEPLRHQQPSSGSRLKKLRALIESYNAAADEDKESALLRISKIKSDYLSAREMIDFVLSRQPKKSTRDRRKDRDTVAFYANTRNSIHNLGKSGAKEDFVYEADGLDLAHAAGGALSTSDRSDIVRLCSELVDIYSDVVAENTGLSFAVFLIAEQRGFEGFGGRVSSRD
jgi:hypothetical protein